jgi:hypothetical protein
MKAGDRIGVEIIGIGTLKNQIVAEAWERAAVCPVVSKSPKFSASLRLCGEKSRVIRHRLRMQ